MQESIHPSLLKRKIIHFDMDCFYAAVEVRDDPRLRGQPLVVGGPPNSRGVVATCSYEARRFGVRSAMSSAMAYRLCPQAIFVPPCFEKYKEASSHIRKIFKRFTDIIEPISLDEAYLDVTGHELYAIQIAKQIKEAIRSELSLTGSAGVAPNKLIAKISSDFHKPDGITVVLPQNVLQFMGALSLRKINGIGPATEKRLLNQGFKFCSQLWPSSQEELSERLGDRLGKWLYSRSRGIDEREVRVSRVRKSLGTETTFAKDILDKEILCQELLKLSRKVSDLLIRRKLSGRTVTLKVRYSDFRRITRSHTLDAESNCVEVLYQEALHLIDKTLAGKSPIRLLGITVSSFETSSSRVEPPSLL